MTQEELMSDEVLKRAIVRSLEIIGEASKQIPEEARKDWHIIPWKRMAGMRDKLIHGYIGINYTIVWDAVTNKIPEVKLAIADMLASYGQE